MKNSLNTTPPSHTSIMYPLQETLQYFTDAIPSPSHVFLILSWKVQQLLNFTNNYTSVPLSKKKFNMYELHTDCCTQKHEIPHIQHTLHTGYSYRVQDKTALWIHFQKCDARTPITAYDSGRWIKSFFSSLNKRHVHLPSLMVCKQTSWCKQVQAQLSTDLQNYSSSL